MRASHGAMANVTSCGERANEWEARVVGRRRARRNGGCEWSAVGERGGVSASQRMAGSSDAASVSSILPSSREQGGWRGRFRTEDPIRRRVIERWVSRNEAGASETSETSRIRRGAVSAPRPLATYPPRSVPCLSPTLSRAHRHRTCITHAEPLTKRDAYEPLTTSQRRNNATTQRRNDAITTPSSDLLTALSHRRPPRRRDGPGPRGAESLLPRPWIP